MPGASADPEPSSGGVTTGPALHATCVLWHGRGVLVLGEPGEGKTSLALELLAHGAQLVADDLVRIARHGDALVARPAGATGLIELRGVGIFKLVHARATRLHLCVTLVAADARPRLPDEESWGLAGVAVPRISLTADGAPLAPRVALALCAKRVG